MDPSSHPPFKGSLLAAGLSSRLSHHITPSSSPQGLSLAACLGSSSLRVQLVDRVLAWPRLASSSSSPAWRS